MGQTQAADVHALFDLDTGTPAVQGMNEIYFNLVLPSGAAPEHGWPVVIFGHGSG